jgi:hypothetical protein
MKNPKLELAIMLQAFHAKLGTIEYDDDTYNIIKDIDDYLNDKIHELQEKQMFEDINYGLGLK